MKDVDVLIVNYRTKELTAEAVRSVLQEPELHKVLVLENASQDDSADYLRAAFAGEQVEIHVSEKNLGFGGGNNLIAKAATAPYLFLINSDAQLQPGGLTLMKEVLAHDSKLGMVAPAIYLPDSQTLQKDAQGSFPTPWSLITRLSRRANKALSPDWVSGVAFMVRRDEYERLGGFAPELFMYYEDVDLCRRYREAGFEIIRHLDAKVVHLGGASKQSTLRQKTDYFHSQDRYLERAGYLFTSRLLVRIIRSPYVLLGRLFLWK